MALSSYNRIQSNSGLITATSSFNVSLPNPTTDSSTLMLYVVTGSTGNVTLQTSSAFDPPWFGDALRASNEYVYRRDSQPAGETSWTIPSIAVSSTYYWWIEEWVGLSTIGQPDANTAIKAATNPSSVTTNTATADVNDFAALAIFRGSSTGTGAVWPASHSYSAGWNEVAWLTNGDGSVTGNFLLAIVESYPGAAGSVSCTLTWDTSGGGTIPNSNDCWVACYQPDVSLPMTVSVSP